MKLSLLSLFVALTLFGCSKNDLKLSSLVDELHSENDSIRFKALERLEAESFSLEQQLLLLDEARRKFPKAKYEWQSIPGQIVTNATEAPDLKVVEAIRKNFKEDDTNARSEALEFLSGFDNRSSIETFKELILTYPSGTRLYSTGILEENSAYKDILFPDLLNVIDNDYLNSSILLLFLNYLDENQLQAKDYAGYVDKLLSLSKRYRDTVETGLSVNVDVWSDGGYQHARYEAGIIVDLFGYFNDARVVSELSSYLKVRDNKLKMFAVVSLIKLGQNVEPSVLEEVAADAESRKWLFDNLSSLDREQLYPDKFKTQEAFAESDLVNWLLYPTELGRKPDAIELMRVVEVDSKSEDGMVEFYVFRFKSNHEDWSDKGWIAGVSGYFPVKHKPSTEAGGYTFSSFEKWEDKTPEQHVAEIRNLIEEASENQE